MTKLGRIETLNYCRKKYNYKYLYSNKSTPATLSVKCPIHGPFTVGTKDHMFEGKECPSCASGTTIDFKAFMKLARKKFYRQYKYYRPEQFSQWGLIRFKCPYHGDITQRVYAHLNGNGCVHCSRGSLSRSQFIKQARKKHGNSYTYKEVPGGIVQGKVKICCKTHGYFMQDSFSHVNGAGCRSCTYTDKYFYLYVFKITGKRKSFYKLGIADDFERREKELRRGLSPGYKIELLQAFKLNTDIGVFLCEYYILDNVEGEPVSKNIMSDGYSESKQTDLTSHQMVTKVSNLLRKYKKGYFEYCPPAQLYGASKMGKKRMDGKRKRRQARRRKVDMELRKNKLNAPRKK